MHGFAILLRKEIAEGWRSRRTPVVLALFFVMGLAAPLLARFTPDIVTASGGAGLAAAIPTPTTADAVDQFGKLTGQLGAFVAILLAMGAVATDRERGTAALLLVKPVGRPAYLASKMVAIAATLLAASIVAGVTATAYTAVLFEVLPPTGTVIAIALTWLGLLVPAAITFLGSVVGRSAAVAAGLGFAWVVLGGILAALPSVGGDMPAALTAQARSFALGAGASGPLAAPLVVTLAILTGAALAAWQAFARLEL
ncbi:MAG: ABC transporter permease [Chloroflexota bacterium]